MNPDVVIIGGGPVGLTLALLLARGSARVTLLERDFAARGALRTVSLDDESLRIWQACGLEQGLLGDWAGGASDRIICRYLDERGRPFLQLKQYESDLGYPHAVTIHESRIVSKLAGAARRRQGIRLLCDRCVERMVQDESGVTVHGVGPDGPFTIRSKWAVACDGAFSAVREQLGIALDGIDLPNPWLVANLIDDNITEEEHVRISCAPGDAWITAPLPHGVRRIECMLDPDDAGSWAADELAVRARLAAAWPGALEAPILAHSIRRFSAAIAERWRSGRVFLAGDAAHTTPPFAGQGLATGLRDVANLAFKLSGVCTGWLDESVLDTYELERRPHQERMIRLALRLGGLMMPRSRWSARWTQSAVRAIRHFESLNRHVELRGRGIRPVYRQGYVTPGGMAGRYLPQPRVRTGDGERVRLDTLLGPRLTWIALGRGSRAGQLAELDIAPGDRVLVENRDFTDPERQLQRRLGPDTAVLVRPDRVIHTHRSRFRARRRRTIAPDPEVGRMLESVLTSTTRSWRPT